MNWNVLISIAAAPWALAKWMPRSTGAHFGSEAGAAEPALADVAVVEDVVCVTVLTVVVDGVEALPLLVVVTVEVDEPQAETAMR